MAIGRELVFHYRFEVSLAGNGHGTAVFGNADYFAGPKPRFELRAGWLTLFPSEGQTQPLQLRHFSDQKRPAPAMPDLAQWWKRQWEPPDPAALALAKAEVEERMRYNRLTRNPTSYSLFVGDALHRVLQAGDELTFIHNGVEEFQYLVLRNAKTVFSAGLVGKTDTGQTIAIWQQYDDPERMQVRKPYISARIRDLSFQLIDGQEAQSDPYYVFLARSNNDVPGGFVIGYWPPAVHAAGSLGELTRELIIDAAHQLAEPKTKIL